MTRPLTIADDLAALRANPRRERTPEEVDALGRRLHAHYTRMAGQERASEDVWPDSVTWTQRMHWCEVAVMMDDDSRRDCAYEILESVTKEGGR